MSSDRPAAAPPRHGMAPADRTGSGVAGSGPGAEGGGGTDGGAGRGEGLPGGVARVLRVTGAPDRQTEVTVIVADRLDTLHWDGEPPLPGHIYTVTATAPLRLGPIIGRAAPGGWDKPGDALRWRTPDVHGRTRMKALRDRHTVKRAVRAYLDGEGFLEVDSSLLARGASPDLSIECFSLDGRYLVSSTEYQIKRMEVGGFDRLYTLTQNFRRGDGEGALRNPEFTMLEWARVGADLSEIEGDVEKFTLTAHRALGGSGILAAFGCEIDLSPPWDRMDVAGAVRGAFGVPMPDFSLASVAEAVAASGIEVREEWSDDLPFLFSLLITALQPSLGRCRPVFLTGWPAFETSSAGSGPDPEIADRSELFIAGCEVSDGFASETDPERQRVRFIRQNASRRKAGMAEVEVDGAYLAALGAGMPRGAGMALGFDRLVMLLAGRTDIRDVLAFAWDEA